MATQPDPRFFDWGNAFLAGRDNAQEAQRRNALLNISQRNQLMREDEYARGIESQQQQAQQAQDEIARRAKIFAQYLPDELKPMAGEFAASPEGAEIEAELIKQRFPQEQKQLGALYKLADGTYGSAEDARGRRFYNEPPQGPVGTWAPPTEVTIDGKPALIQAHSVTGQIRPVEGVGPKAGKPPVVADPAAQLQDTQNVLAAINNAKNLIKWNTTGLVGQQLGGLGGTDAYNLRAALDTVKASIGFDRLQRMREESKTGGALGQIAVRELDLLQATIASLDANQSGNQLGANLDRVRKQYEKTMAAYQKALGGTPESKPDDRGEGAGAKVIDYSELPE